MKIVKKNGSLVSFDGEKIRVAIRKSASRVMTTLTQEQEDYVVNKVYSQCSETNDNIKVVDLHKMVELALMEVDVKVGEAYRSYRNYKTDLVHMFDKFFQQAHTILYQGDKENSNADSSLASTKQSLIRGYVSKELYQRFFLTEEEIKACDEGAIYVHDQRDRLFGMNCCLADITNIMTGGFEMGNLWYNEPKTLDVAFDVLGDIIMSMASQEYGGYTVPHIDDILVPYCEKSYDVYFREFVNMSLEYTDKPNLPKADDYALNKIKKDLLQGFQGLEMKLNSVASSRGDYIFTTFSFGLNETQFGQMITEAILEVRKNGQGREGHKKPVLFPKLAFLYTDKLHGIGKPLEHLFNKAIECSAKAMYPDFVSLDNLENNFLADMYHNWGGVVSPMGCRAYLSPWFVKGGQQPLDDTDRARFVGRFNLGAVTLNLCWIYQEAKVTGQDFYKLLDYYLEMIRSIHQRTYEYVANLKASTNPLGFTQGGFLGGKLDYDDKIGLDLLKPMTASFGYTALNELCMLHYGKSIIEDNSFAIEVMKYINDKVKAFKEEDGWLYAIYGTPAESLVGLQVEQFKKRFGTIEGIFDKDYVSNSFHCGVWEDISPFEKQDAEEELFHLSAGGRITYTRYYDQTNLEAMRLIVRRGMAKGFYQGVNLALSYCDDCGHEEIDMDSCTKCGSYNLTKVDRMNGYLSYSRVKGDSRLNDAKMSEIADRKSM